LRDRANDDGKTRCGQARGTDGAVDVERDDLADPRAGIERDEPERLVARRRAGLDSSEVSELRAVVERREKLKTPLGEQWTVRVRLTTEFAGKLQAKSDLIIYFTDNEAHVPVRIEADLALGTVVVEAVEYHTGLRMPVRPKAATRTEVR